MKKDRPVRRILVVRLYGIGNAIVSIPFCRAVRKRFPDAEISVLADKRNEDIMRALDVFNHVYILPSRHSVFTYVRLFFLLINMRPDVIFSLFPMYHFALSWLYRASGAHTIVGHDYRTSRWCYTQCIPCDLKRHECDLNLDLLAVFGQSDCDYDRDMRFSIPDKAYARAETFLTLAMLRRPIVVMHCGAQKDLLQKRWPCQSFVTLADTIKANYDVVVIFVGGADDRARVDTVRLLMKSQSYSCVGEYDLMATAALLSRASVFIGNDSGISHMAAACQVPVIALFGPTDPSRVAPVGPQVQIITASVECAPCHVPGEFILCGDEQCMKHITVDEVYEAVCQVLDKSEEVS